MTVTRSTRCNIIEARKQPALHLSRFNPQRTLQFTLVGCVLGVITVTQIVQAQNNAARPAVTETKSFNIPAGPLDAALDRFARGAGINLSYKPALIGNATTKGLVGDCSISAGLSALLSGSGLEAIAQPGGGYALKKAGPIATEKEAMLPAVRVKAQTERGAKTEGTISYAAPVVTIGKGEQDVKDIPQSVSVLTRQRMDDQNLVDLRDAANSVTGVIGVQGVGPGLVITSRGFFIDDWQYDGVPIPRNHYALGNWASETMVFYDRMEVLRGASGLLQGTGSPGGAVNMVRKRGQIKPTVAFTGAVGSWNHYGLQLDAGGPLNTAGTVRGRAVADEDRSDSFTDDVWDRTRSLYASLDHDIAPDTTVGLGVSNKHSRSRPAIVGLPRYADTSDIGLPRSTFTGASWNRAANDQTTVFADLNHRFNDSWALKVSALTMREDNSSVTQRIAGVIAADGSGLRYGDFATDFDARKDGLDIYLRGHFDTSSVAHEVTVGANNYKYTSDDVYARAWTAGGNIFAIQHDRPWQDFDSIAARGVVVRSTYDVQQKGVYGAWRARLFEPLTAIVGARVSWYDNVYKSDDYEDASQASNEITPYAGLVYAVNTQWSAYASYTSVFEPQSARTVSGELLEPIVGTNYELGLKSALLENRVNSAFSVFRYDHKNRAAYDYDAGFACDGWYCYRPSGKVRSQGFEAEVSGEVIRGLQLFAGYAYVASKYLSDPESEGQVYSTWTPKHLLRMWADYKLPGSWNQLSLGGGGTTQSHTLSQDRDFTLPGFTIWNARVAYQWSPQVSLALNVNNVFDKRYYIPSYNAVNANNYYGDPRNVMFTVKYTPKL